MYTMFVFSAMRSAIQALLEGFNPLYSWFLMMKIWKYCLLYFLSFFFFCLEGFFMFVSLWNVFPCASPSTRAKVPARCASPSACSAVPDTNIPAPNTGIPSCLLPELLKAQLSAAAMQSLVKRPSLKGVRGMGVLHRGAAVLLGKLWSW